MDKKEYCRLWREKNPDRVKTNNRNWYIQNKQRALEKSVKRQEIKRKEFLEYKSKLSCEVCGYNSNTNILQFHHRDPTHKEVGIANISRRGFNYKLVQELSKCTVLCPNCHMDLHDKANNQRYQE